MKVASPSRLLLAGFFESVCLFPWRLLINSHFGKDSVRREAAALQQQQVNQRQSCSEMQATLLLPPFPITRFLSFSHSPLPLLPEVWGTGVCWSPLPAAVGRPTTVVLGLDFLIHLGSSNPGAIRCIEHRKMGKSAE